MLPRKNPYTFFDEFVLRTATFSFKLYHELGDKKKIRKKELLSIWNRPECKEALFLASPDFYSICEHFFNDVNNHYNERVEQSLLKYTARMCSRATPFGLFAGITTGKISENTAIELSKTTAFKRKSRLDMSFILALSQQLSKQESLQRQLRFFLNSSLYKTADHYRYVEYTVKETERHYSLEGIESTAHLEKILLEARKGKTISALAKSLVSEEIAFQEATHYIKMLIDHQVLVSELEIQLTGEDNLTVLIAFLNLLENTTAYQRTLKTIEQLLSKLDEKVGNEVSQYNTLYQLLGKTEIAYKKQQSIQTDLFVQCTSNTLSKKVAYTVQNALTVLNKLNPVQEHKNLIAFKKAFWERYETREVPLTTVLDIESGIGYGHDQVKKGITPFLDDIQLPKSQPLEKEEISTHPVAIYLEQKLLKTIHSRHYIMELIDKELQSFSCSWEDLPDTFSAMIEIIETKNKEQIILKSVGGTSAANLHARFCHGSEALKNHIQHITDWEAQLHPDKILAEIVHLPEARTGNILKRPAFRKYEIPYLAKSNLALENQIPINDLTISIRINKIILRSKRLNKEVLSKLTNAHNYSLKALPIYYFLSDLQKQNLRTALSFTWPKKVGNHPFLPRVVYKSCILSKAQWQLKKEDINTFLKVYEDEEKLIQKIDLWRKKYQVPDWIELVENDNTLPIHLENSTLIRLLLTTIKNKERCKLQEFLLPQSDLVKRAQEIFGHEIVLSFYKDTRL